MLNRYYQLGSFTDSLIFFLHYSWLIWVKFYITLVPLCTFCQETSVIPEIQ